MNRDRGSDEWGRFVHSLSEVGSEGSDFGSARSESRGGEARNGWGPSASSKGRGPERYPRGARGGSTMTWGTCDPSPVAKEVEATDEGGPTCVDHSSWQG